MGKCVYVARRGLARYGVTWVHATSRGETPEITAVCHRIGGSVIYYTDPSRRSTPFGSQRPGVRTNLSMSEQNASLENDRNLQGFHPRSILAYVAFRVASSRRERLGTIENTRELILVTIREKDGLSGSLQCNFLNDFSVVGEVGLRTYEG